MRGKETVGGEAYYPVAPGGGEPGFDVREVLAFLRRRRGWIVGFALIGAIAGGIVGYARPPKYQAQALVLIQPPQKSGGDINTLDALAYGNTPSSAFVETQIRIARSRAFLNQAVDRLRLVPEDPERLRILAVERADGGRNLPGWLTRMLPEGLLFSTGLAEDRPLLSPDALREELRRQQLRDLLDRVTVRQEGRSLILSIGYSSENPFEAARIANGLAELFVSQQVDDRVAARRSADEWLRTRIAELGDELRRLENTIEEYRAKHDLLERQGLTPESEQAQALTNMLVETRANRREKEARIRYIQQLMRRGEKLNALSEVLESRYMQSLWERESALQQQEAELLNTYGPKHPVVVRLREEKRKLRAQQRKEVGRIVENIRNEIAVLKAREVSLQQDIDALMQKGDEAARAAIKLRELEREAQANREVYENFLRQQKEVEAKLKLTQPSARIVARAEPPEKPSSIPPQLFALLGLVGSGFAGLGLALVRERLDNGIRSAREVEGLFGLPCFAQVPHLASRTLKRYGEPHAYLLAKPLSAFAEGVRGVHTALRTLDIDNPPKIVQVTSAVPSEGKTSMAACLAVSLVREGNSVLLVDLDLRRPTLSRLFSREGGPTLLDALLGEVPLDKAIQTDEASGVDLLSVGKPVDNPGAILGSRRLRDLLGRLRERYDYVVLDSTPTLGLSDAKRAAALADATLFLIRWEKTPVDTVEDALKELADHKIEVAGTALTMVDVKRQSRYGYESPGRYYTSYYVE